MATGSSLSRDTGSAPTGAWSAGPRWLLRCPQDRLIGLREKPLATSSSRSTLKPNGARLMACADLGVNARPYLTMRSQILIFKITLD